nr:MAG: replication associated protein [Arizlama virus]
MFHYIFTYHNYTVAEKISLRSAVGQAGVQYIIFGEEVCPSTGTPHLQGYLQMNHKNIQRINKKFTDKVLYLKPAKAESGLNARELEEGTFMEPYSARGYCMKDGNYVEAGEPTHIPAKEQGKRNDLQAVQDDINAGHNYQTISSTHFEASAKYNKFFKEQIAMRNHDINKAAALARYEPLIINDWQRRLIAMIQEPATHRIIHWLWSEGGSIGKSDVATYMAAKYDAVIMEVGKYVDMAYVWANSPVQKVAIFDIPRTMDEKYFLHLYSMAENLKNGRIMTSKYESKTIYFAPPHVIFFANQPPDMTKWTGNRYNVIKLD